MEYTVPRLCQKYTCSEWTWLLVQRCTLYCNATHIANTTVIRQLHTATTWLYASGYPLKCIGAFFPIGTQNLHSGPQKLQTDRTTVRWDRANRNDRPKTFFTSLLVGHKTCLLSYIQPRPVTTPTIDLHQRNHRVSFGALFGAAWNLGSLESPYV